MTIHLEGVLVGAASLLIIGVFHPIVIWCEYYFSARVWPFFLAVGGICLVAALFTTGYLSIFLGLLGVACLCSIRELLEQEERVKKGWFPKREDRK